MECVPKPTTPMCGVVMSSAPMQETGNETSFSLKWCDLQPQSLPAFLLSSGWYRETASPTHMVK